MTGDALILLLRFAFVALLYLFLFNLVAAIRRDLGRAVERGTGATTGPVVAAPAEQDGRLIVLDGGAADLERGGSVPLRPTTVIGRAPDSDVRLNDTFVSARHARLRRRDGRWFVADLGSTNGTLLNQQPLDGEQPIEYGDVIEIGEIRLKLAP